MSTTAAKALRVFRESEILHDQETVEAAIASMGRELDKLLADDQTEILALSVMTGAIILAGKLLPHISAPLRIDYLHATRYQEDTTGGKILWLREPSGEIAGRTVLILDDILDEGYTLEAIAKYCRDAGAARVVTAVLTEKERDRDCEFKADVVGLKVPNCYVFGYGMDYRGFLRNAPGIFAVSEEYA